jgi:hypothetical protein
MVKTAAIVMVEMAAVVTKMTAVEDRDGGNDRDGSGQ